MAVPSPLKLGNHTVAIAIDKDKASQGAVKWAVEHLLKGKNTNVVLIHVKTQNIPFQPESAFKAARQPSEPDSQHLFLPYRGFCARKGFDAHEVVLHDVDVSSALINYLRSNSIGTIVVGASNRNALTRLIKQTDVPTSLTKAAPGFCAVYVISKGKVQSQRVAITKSGSPSSTVSSRSTASNNSAKSYIAYFSSQSTCSTNSSITSTSSSSTHSKYTPTSSASGNQVSEPGSPRGYDYNNASNDSLSSASTTYYNARLQSMLGQSALHPSHPDGGANFDDTSRDYYSGRQSRKSEDMDESWDNQGARSPARFMQSPRPRQTSPRFNQSQGPPARKMQTPDIRTGRGHNLPYVRSMLSDGPNYNSQSNSFASGTGSSSTSDSYDQTFYSSSSAHGYGNELANEIRRLKADIQKAEYLYQTISDQATTAKKQADDILNGEEGHTVENINVARQAVQLVAELEKLRTKAAADAEKMTERLAELEAQKKNTVEQRVKSKDNQIRATNAAPMTHQIYSLEEIEEATNYFSASQQIGEGGYGPVYRAMLQQTPVAIKVLRPDVSQGLKQFQQEIEVLGRIRHPNMVLLLGACPQYGCIIYEYMDNGSLEDRLFRKNGTPTIPWRARFKIASEIATGLLFLHQTKPDPMVHRDLKPANILLDANYRSKIADVGLARLVPPTVANEMTQYHMTAAAGTFCYIDPEYQQTGQLGTKSDVYSLGVIFLQIITAKPPMALAYHVENAIDKGEFDNMLDPTIPDWPIEQALSLAQLALKCCELRKKDRPDLDSVVLPELIRLRDFAMNT